MARASYDETPVSTCGTGKKAEDRKMFTFNCASFFILLSFQAQLTDFHMYCLIELEIAAQYLQNVAIGDRFDQMSNPSVVVNSIVCLFKLVTLKRLATRNINNWENSEKKWRSIFQRRRIKSQTSKPLPKQQQGKRYIGECVFTQPFALCSNLIDQSISICQQGVQVTLEFSEFIQTAECAV
ncbi:hypothetical protein T11_18061 [Trichinella zimbabwensis]|uniref:Uncharacterized protein n=1 Tax=Trichinella zimbabwensis TaxID=268475 RepID=A0A0V1GVY6_9BILA|nr:hypothetical protein T11_18061 [Trichinella zimbabwensis]